MNWVNWVNWMYWVNWVTPNLETLKNSLHKTAYYRTATCKTCKFRLLSDRPTVETDVQKIGGAQLQYILLHFKLISGSEPQNLRTSSLHKTYHIAVRLHVKSPKFSPLSDNPTVETDVQNRRCTTSIYIASFQIDFRFRTSKF